MLSTVLRLQAMNGASQEFREHSHYRSGRGRMHCFRGGFEFALKAETGLLGGPSDKGALGAEHALTPAPWPGLPRARGPGPKAIETGFQEDGSGTSGQTPCFRTQWMHVEASGRTTWPLEEDGVWKVCSAQGGANPEGQGPV